MAMPQLPNAEAAWVTYLRGTGWNAATQVPKLGPIAAGTLRLSRTGGGRPNIVQDEPQLLFEVWEVSAAAASAICHDLNTAVVNAEGVVIAPGCRVDYVDATGPVEFPDPDSQMIRYQFTATVRHRLVATT